MVREPGKGQLRLCGQTHVIRNDLSIAQRKQTRLEPEFLDTEKVEIVLVGNKPVLDRSQKVLDNLASFAEAHAKAAWDQSGDNVFESIFEELGLGKEFERKPLFEGRFA